MIKKIHNFLIENNKTISVCESITAGALSSKLISNPGSSAFFKGSLVVYNDEIIGEYDLLSLKDVKKVNFLSRLFRSINYLIWGDV